MKIQLTSLADLSPSVSSVKLSNILVKFNDFNPELFNPISLSQDSGRNIIVNGHHRTALTYIASSAYGIDFKVPSFFEKKVFGSPIILYSQRSCDFVGDISIDLSSEHSVRLSDTFTRDQDVYAKVNGNSQYLFTLPDKELFQEISRIYSGAQV